MNALLDALVPELRQRTGRERQRLLDRARETPFDAVELLGMAASIVVVTALTRYGVHGLDIAERFVAALVNFVIALPLLAVGVAPFFLRRLRRGLREELERRGSG